MTSPLYPTFEKRVHDAFEQLITHQVTPWAFVTAGPPFKIAHFDGRPISYHVAQFDGSPRDVFWGRYIEPFLEHLCVPEIDAAVTMARERSQDARLLLLELEGLLLAGVKKTYSRMAEVDQRLCGKGYPERIPRRNVEIEVAAMREFIDVRIRAQRAMWQPKSALSVWYEKNPFWVWVVATLLLPVFIFLLSRSL